MQVCLKLLHISVTRFHATFELLLILHPLLGVREFPHFYLLISSVFISLEIDYTNAGNDRPVLRNTFLVRNGMAVSTYNSGSTPQHQQINLSFVITTLEGHTFFIFFFEVDIQVP